MQSMSLPWFSPRHPSQSKYNRGVEVIRPYTLPTHTAESWKLLFYYNLYRFCLAVFLGTLVYVPRSVLAHPSFQALPDLPITGLLLISVIVFITGYWRRPSLSQQVHITFVLDILLFGTILLSGNLEYSMLVALHVTIAAVAITLRPFASSIYALACVLLVLVPHYESLPINGTEQGKFNAFLVTTIAVYVAASAIGYVAKKAFRTLAQFDDQGEFLGALGRINRLAVDKLDIGIAVLDNTLNIRQINDSALAMIGNLIHNDRISGELARRVISAANSSDPTRLTTNSVDRLLAVSVFPLNNSIFLTIENKTDTAERMRESKLPSVGRTALSIAHEIRNPLNAINQAAELLTPMDGAENNHTALLRDIKSSVQRIDSVVDTVIMHSRAGLVEPVDIQLTPWLQNFVENFEKKQGAKNIHFTISGDPIAILFDNVQFDQIVTNLCNNSIEHSTSINMDVEISLHTGMDRLRNAYFEIWDYGKPLNAVERKTLFEPFQDNSMGVDFYLIREICEANGATVEYHGDSTKSGFRIAFQMLGNDARPKI